MFTVCVWWCRRDKPLVERPYKQRTRQIHRMQWFQHRRFFPHLNSMCRQRQETPQHSQSDTAKWWPNWEPGNANAKWITQTAQGWSWSVCISQDWHKTYIHINGCGVHTLMSQSKQFDHYCYTLHSHKSSSRYHRDFYIKFSSLFPSSVEIFQWISEDPISNYSPIWTPSKISNRSFLLTPYCRFSFRLLLNFDSVIKFPKEYFQFELVEFLSWNVDETGKIEPRTKIRTQKRQHFYSISVWTIWMIFRFDDLFFPFFSLVLKICFVCDCKIQREIQVHCLI